MSNFEVHSGASCCFNLRYRGLADDKLGRSRAILTTWQRVEYALTEEAKPRYGRTVKNEN